MGVEWVGPTHTAVLQDIELLVWSGWVGPMHTAVLQATELWVWSGWVLRIQQYCWTLSCWCGVGGSYAYSSTAGH